MTSVDNSRTIVLWAILVNQVFLACLVIGRAEESPPLSVEFAEFLLYLDTYRFIYIYISIFQAIHRARAANMRRTNIGPTSWGSKVNMITLKTATLLLRCS